MLILKHKLSHNNLRAVRMPLLSFLITFTVNTAFTNLFSEELKYCLKKIKKAFGAKSFEL